MKSAPAIAFDLRPSRGIAVAVTAVGLLASAAPWLTGLPAPARGALSFSAAVWACFALHRFLHPPFRRVAWRPSGWALVDPGGGEHPALLASHARLGGVLVLGFRHGATGRFRFVVAPDNLDAEGRRRLCLLLARPGVAGTS